MREIKISTDVFAKIWANRKDGENIEDDILRRILGCELPVRDSKHIPKKEGGFFDGRSNVHFPEGFEIFKNYIGKEYRARASNGKWIRMDTNEDFDSLNELSDTIFKNKVNAWNIWSFRDNNHKVQQITKLRDQSKISKRQRKPSDFDLFEGSDS